LSLETGKGAADPSPALQRARRLESGIRRPAPCLAGVRGEPRLEASPDPFDHRTPSFARGGQVTSIGLRPGDAGRAAAVGMGLTDPAPSLSPGPGRVLAA